MWSVPLLLALAAVFPPDRGDAMPPPADSRAGLCRRVDSALERVAVLPAPALGGVARESRRSCEAVCAQPPSCKVGDLASCEKMLASLYDAAQAQRSGADPLSKAAWARAAIEVGGALSGLTHLSDATGCRRRALPRGARPARIVLAPDARHAQIEPLVPLRGGRRYDVVIEGVADSDAVTGSPVLPAGVGDPSGFSGPLGEAGRVRSAELVARSVQARPPGEASGNFVGVPVVFPETLRGDDLRRLRASFVPVADAKPAGVVTEVETLDARAGLRAYRQRLRSIACDTDGATLSPGTTVPGVPTGTKTFRGRYVSLDIVGRRGGDGLGVPAAEALVVTHPFELLLPPVFESTTPLVLILDGHMGSARRMMGRHAAELLAAGLAVVAVDLPAHGERTIANGAFVTPLEPARLSRNMRQAATDILAVVRYAVVCGFRLPQGERYQPTEVRFVGYSLGAMVGVIARSIEPDLGATSLIAPGGDLLGWLMLRVGLELGSRYVTCIGGPQHGENCVADGRCASPGHCVVDPHLENLYQWIERPYSLASAGGDPLSFATERTGGASNAPLLLITAGKDAALHAELGGQLADAYAMAVSGPYERRGTNSIYVHWPLLGHDLPSHAEPRRQAHEFVIQNGRLVLPVEVGDAPAQPLWYPDEVSVIP